MYLTLSICVLLVSLMQLVTRVQFLNTTTIPLFSPLGTATIMVPLTSIDASL